MSIRQKYIKKKNFHQIVFLSNYRRKVKNRVSLTSMAMATNFNVRKTSICLLVKPIKYVLKVASQHYWYSCDGTPKTRMSKPLRATVKTLHEKSLQLSVGGGGGGE